MGSKRKRVAVIGAGPSGLGCISELKEEGLEPVCFERTARLGGLWCYDDSDTDGVPSVMRTTIINSSKELGAISKFPPPAEFPNYMHHTLMHKYITMAAEKGDAIRHVNLNHLVVSVVPTDDYQETGKWVVTTKHTETGVTSSSTFDGVMVCVGHHVYPSMPSFPGMGEFQGKIMHTHSLKKVDGFEDQRVVVVGVGNSGMDAAVEISSVAKQVYLSTRRGTWVISRLGPYGHPVDAFFHRRLIHFLIKHLPKGIMNCIMETFLNQRFDHSLYNLKPQHGVMNQHPTLSDSLPVKLISGTVVVRKSIKEFTRTGVIFEGDEKVTEVDTVVFATGYEIKFPFLSDDTLPVKNNVVKLYKNIFPPHLPHPTLAIVGLIQPNGPGFPPGELQCRWSSMVMSGRCSLPSQEEMLKDIQKKDEIRRQSFVNSPRHTIQVDFLDYQDELAELIGVKPNFWKMALTDPKLFWACITGPSLPYQYRLHGPHAWEGARDAILTYKERVIAPLSDHSKVQQKKKNHFLIGFPIAFLLPLLLWFFITTVFAITW